MLSSNIPSFYLRNHKGPLRKHFTQYDAFLASLALYVIFKGLYNFLLVAIWHQGHWYYPLSILITNVIIARGLSLFMMIRSFNDAHLTLSPKSLKFLFSIVFLLCGFVLLFVYSSIAPLNTLALTAVITSTMFGSISLTGLYLTQRKNLSVRLPYVLAISVLFVPLIGNSILSIKETTSYNQKYEIFFNNRENLKSALENLDPNFKFLSFDDGIIAYSLQSPTMSGLGFALDKEAYKAKVDANLLGLAYSRGYIWLTSLNYMPSFDAKVGDDVTLHLEKVWWIQSSEAKKYRYRLVYIDPVTKLKVISFKPIT